MSYIVSLERPSVLPTRAAWRTALGLLAGLVALSFVTWQVAHRAPVLMGPPAPRLHFSSTPVDDDFLRTGLFDEPLVPVGKAGPAENRDLARALLAYDAALGKTHDRDAVDSVVGFLDGHPTSAWKPSLLYNLGAAYRVTGHFSKALATWQSAWDLSKHFDDPHGHAVGDASLAQLSQLEAYLGRKELLGPLLEEAKGRQVRGTAHELVVDSTRGLSDMTNRPEVSFKCGPMALSRILSRGGGEPPAAALKVLEGAHSTPNGLSLTAVRTVSAEAGMNYQMAFRAPRTPLVTPAVVHWKTGHYAALLRADTPGYYNVEDPTFGPGLRVSQQTLEEEITGYFLVPPGPLPPGWRPVDATEGSGVWGRGNTGGNRDGGGTGPGGGGGFPCGQGGGCTNWNVEPMVVGLSLHDDPVGYKPAVGPEIRFKMYYSQRDVQQPATFTYTNFGLRWTMNWLSYVTDNASCVLIGGPNASKGTVDLYLPGGGEECFPSVSTTPSPPGPYSQSTLTRTVNASGATTGFVRLMPDGTTYTFGQQLTGSPSGPGDVPLTVES